MVFTLSPRGYLKMSGNMFGCDYWGCAVSMEKSSSAQLHLTSYGPMDCNQASLHMEFSRQEHWSGAPFPTPGHLSDSGTQPMTLVSPALADGFFTTGATGEALDAVKYPAVTRTASPQYELFNSNIGEAKSEKSWIRSCRRRVNDDFYVWDISHEWRSLVISFMMRKKGRGTILHCDYHVEWSSILWMKKYSDISLNFCQGTQLLSYL